MREITVKVFDDLDFHEYGERNEACATVTVGLNGTWRELEVTEKNEKEVRATLERLMAAGHDPDHPVMPPKNAAPAEVIARNEAIRDWCRETGLMNSSGTGYAYQTNTTLLNYIGKPLIRKYEEYLARKEGK